jgi:uncharacterized membrane protein YkvA (DUF1232 family)
LYREGDTTLESNDTHHDAVPTSTLLPAEPLPGRGEPLVFADEPSGDDKVLDRFWMAVRRLPKYLRLAANLARDHEVPKSAKALLAVGGAYSISPIDLVPGIIPVAGQLDDMFVLLFVLRWATRSSPPAVAAAHLQRVGLQQKDFDDDIAATKDTARWLVGKGLHASKSIAMTSGRGASRLWREHLRPGH